MIDTPYKHEPSPRTPAAAWRDRVWEVFTEAWKRDWPPMPSDGVRMDRYERSAIEAGLMAVYEEYVEGLWHEVEELNRQIDELENP